MTLIFILGDDFHDLIAEQNNIDIKRLKND